MSAGMLPLEATPRWAAKLTAAEATQPGGWELYGAASVVAGYVGFCAGALREDGLPERAASLETAFAHLFSEAGGDAAVMQEVRDALALDVQELDVAEGWL